MTEIIRDETLRCRHFRSMLENDTCRAGVEYVSLPYGYRPCFGDVGPSVCQCDRHEPFTSAEIADCDQQLTEAIRMMAKALAVIQRGTVGSGTIECPKCGGDLHWARARSNGHIHGHCSTKGCISWVQ